MQRGVILAATISLFCVATFFAFTAYADSPVIPQWIRNNAKWWSEGSISDGEFLKGMQYLAQQGIIQVQIPVTQVTATNGNPSDNDRVTSIVVHFKDLQNFPSGTTDFTINSFQRIIESGQTASSFQYTGTGAVPTSAKLSPEFQLIDLPSKDKSQYYQFIHAALEAQMQIISQQPTADVDIDLYTGDGTLLNTLSYQKCNVNNYWVGTDSNKLDYRMASDDQTEFREYTDFVCQGYHLITASH